MKESKRLDNGLCISGDIGYMGWILEKLLDSIMPKAYATENIDILPSRVSDTEMVAIARIACLEAYYD
jgi:hypothetical protein